VGGKATACVKNTPQTMVCLRGPPSSAAIDDDTGYGTPARDLRRGSTRRGNRRRCASLHCGSHRDSRKSSERKSAARGQSNLGQDELRRSEQGVTQSKETEPAPSELEQEEEERRKERNLAARREAATKRSKLRLMKAELRETVCYGYELAFELKAEDAEHTGGCYSSCLCNFVQWPQYKHNFGMLGSSVLRPSHGYLAQYRWCSVKRESDVPAGTRAPRWQQARRRAKAARRRHRACLAKARKAQPPAQHAQEATQSTEAAVVEESTRRVEHPYPAIPRERLVGKPWFAAAHSSAQKFARSGVSGLPACWDPDDGDTDRVQVHFRSLEYAAVTSYFIATMMCAPSFDLKVVSLERLQNRSVYARYAEGGVGNETVMFHGCRTIKNEKGIIQDGFQVCKCFAGGTNYGTWFAYNAHYSNGGYVHCWGGVRYIFVCVVSDRYVVHVDRAARVVAQDCAYPLWLLGYTWDEKPPIPEAPDYTAYPRRKRRSKGQSPAPFFHEVCNGRWLKFSIGSRKKHGARCLGHRSALAAIVLPPTDQTAGNDREGARKRLG